MKMLNQINSRNYTGTLSGAYIHTINEVRFNPRISALPKNEAPSMAEDMTVLCDKNVYYHEVREFIDLVLAGKRESTINSHENSLITIEIIDEVRRQLGVVYPADAKT